jgi:hypothetical protein
VLNGTIEHFRFDTSSDGAPWHTAVERSSFANEQLPRARRQPATGPVVS